MSFFPFFKEIAGASGLIIGGGRVAFRKVEKLLSYGPELTVIAPHILPEFQRLSVKLIERDFHENDLAKLPQFVIAASDDRELNKRIALLCQAADIPVNVVDQPDCCTFLFPALVKKGDLSIGISTSGASPSAAVWLKEEIERLLPAHMEQSLEWLRKRRIAAKEQMGEAVLRTRYLKQIFSDCMEGEAAAGIMSAAADEVETEAAAGIGSRTVDEGKVEAAGIGNRAEGGVAAGTEHGVTKEEDAGTGHPAPGCVFLVGAGCGLKGWITVEGLALLQYCDAVVYDDLIDPGLLAEVSPAAEKIYAGKRSRRNSAKQEQIQELLVRLAKESKIVVRLKGGDPFVFGRGGEEIQYLNQHQIPWRVIPGISSALAIPAEAGIPVTHRGVSRSIHIMTAHTRDDILRRDMEQFAMLEGTLVFLMGLESLAMIVAVLTENGRSVDTPAAVLSGGNAAHPCKIAGNLGNIVERAAQENAVTPAVIIVGDVVALDFCRKESPPLSGVTAGLTGTDDFQDKMRRKLLPLGVDAVSLMRGKCEALSCVVPWAQITDMQEKWIVFTSVQGVRYFFRQRRKEKVDCRRFASCRFAVIGEATRKELEKYGFAADLCPAVYTSDALAGELLRNRQTGQPVYLFCSKQGSELFAEKLQEAQVECHRFDLYDTCFLPNPGQGNAPAIGWENAPIPGREDAPAIGQGNVQNSGQENAPDCVQESAPADRLQSLWEDAPGKMPENAPENMLGKTPENGREKMPEYILFGSAGGVQALHRSGYRMREGSQGICIGPICADAYRKCFQQEPVVAGAATVEAMGEALLALAAEKRKLMYKNRMQGNESAQGLAPESRM